MPATKSYTTQLAALVVLGLGLGADPALRGELARVPDAVARAIESDVDPLVVRAVRCGRTRGVRSRVRRIDSVGAVPQGS